MRSRLTSTLLLACLLASGCAEATSRVDDLRATAEGVVQNLRWCAAAVELAAAVARQDVDAAVAAAQELRDAAPPELEADVALLLAAAQEARAGDVGRLGEPDVGAAAGRIRDAVTDRCDPR